MIYECSGFLFCLYSCSFLSDATLLKCALCVCVLEHGGLEPAELGQKGWSSEKAFVGPLRADGIVLHVNLLAEQTAQEPQRAMSTLLGKHLTLTFFRYDA